MQYEKYKNNEKNTFYINRIPTYIIDEKDN